MTNSDLHNMINDVLAKARSLFHFDMKVEINIRNMGRVGGTAQLIGNRYILNLNEQLMNSGYQNAFETVTHEIAHLVCFRFPHLGRNHDRGWKRVDRLLGGTGARCHSMPLEKKRRTRKAIYHIDGRQLEIGYTQHQRIQNGRRYHIKSSGTEILPGMFTGKTILA